MKRFFSKLLPPLPLIFPAAVSGFLLTLCFPPVSWWPLVFVALVPVTAALLRRRPPRKDVFKTGFLCGLCFYTSLMWWIVMLLPTAGVTIPGLMTPALLLLVLYLGLYIAFYFLLTTTVARFRLIGVIAAGSGFWVVLDIIRARGELAFPWGALGYTLSYAPPLIQTAAVSGLQGLTLAVVLVNLLMTGVLLAPAMRWRIVSGASAIVIVGALWLQGHAVLQETPAAEKRSIRVAVVQPNVDLAVKWKREWRDSTLNLIDRLTREAAARGADLIVFPETAAPTYIEGRDPSYKIRLTELAEQLQVPIFIGFLDHRYDGPHGALNIYNASGLFDRNGRLDKYDKNHLLPFSEQLPLSWKFRWLRKLNFGQANFERGPARPPIEVDSTAFTPLICFESVFPYLCRRSVDAGSEFLVNITNDGWFGDTPGPYQHAQMSILRSVEFRRYLVRSANSGVSMVVDPWGRVVERLGLDQQGILTADIGLRDEKTFYDRYGDWPVFVLSLVLIGVGAAAGRWR